MQKCIEIFQPYAHNPVRAGEARQMVVRAVSPTLTADRTYWHLHLQGMAWHANVAGLNNVGVCGRTPLDSPRADGYVDHADRIPPNAHLCGSCARVIAARTDVES